MAEREYNLPLNMWHNVHMASTVNKLNRYFEDWLGRSAGSEQKMLQLVEAGLPTSVVARLIQRGLSRDEVYSVIINPRTLKHRKSRKQPLSREESERAIRTVRIISRAHSVLGDEQKAFQWLRAPKKRFEGRAPIEMLATEPGGRMVEQMLIQIDEGMFG
jgi:putative toxin-antitoxin system antitoxin component (TIGR02293 family)